jgi:hypothetical protein
MGYIACCMSVMLSPFNRMRPGKGFVSIYDYDSWEFTHLVHAGALLPLRTPLLPRPKLHS